MIKVYNRRRHLKRIRELGKCNRLSEEIWKEDKRVQMRKKKGKKKILNSEAEVFKRSELLEKYIVKILFG